MKNMGQARALRIVQHKNPYEKKSDSVKAMEGSEGALKRETEHFLSLSFWSVEPMGG